MPIRLALLATALSTALPAEVQAASTDSASRSQTAASTALPPTDREAFLREQNTRFAIGAHYDKAWSEDVHLVGLHIAQLENRKIGSAGWGFSAQFGITPGMLERDTANHASEIAPSDATPTGQTRLRALQISGGVNLCLQAPVWLELGGGYYLPERVAGFRSKNGNFKWYAAGDNSALPMAMAAVLVDFSSYRVPVYLRLGASRADNTTFYSLGLGWAPTLPK